MPRVEQELLSPSGVHVFTPFRNIWVHPRFLVGSCYSIFSFMCILCRSLLVLLSFFSFSHCVSVLLRFRDSDYPLCIFKLFLKCNEKVTKCCIAIYELLVLSEDLNSPPVLVWFALVNPRVSLWYFVNHCFVWFFLSDTSGHLRTSAIPEFIPWY